MSAHDEFGDGGDAVPETLPEAVRRQVFDGFCRALAALAAGETEDEAA